MKVEDAVNFIVGCLRSEQSNKYGSYGYEMYMPKVIGDYLGASSWDHERQKVTELSPYFYAAAWDLCRRGILRPGIKEFDTKQLPMEALVMAILLLLSVRNGSRNRIKIRLCQPNRIGLRRCWNLTKSALD